MFTVFIDGKKFDFDFISGGKLVVEKIYNILNKLFSNNNFITKCLEKIKNVFLKYKEDIEKKISYAIDAFLLKVFEIIYNAFCRFIQSKI